jgi:long-chain acyl-CoA synthetase
MNQPFRTLAELFLQITAQDRPLLHVKRDGQWQALSAHDVRRRVARTGFRLAEMGLRRGDRIALLAENMPEWAIADYAGITAGFVIVPIYPTLTAPQCEYILRDSGARAVFVSSAEHCKKIASVRPALPELRWFIQMLPPYEEGAVHLEDLYGAGALSAEESNRFEHAATAPQPEDLFSILYTSGTTGKPKGVMLSHRNLASNIQSSAKLIGEGDVALSFLPLSHVYERMADYTFAWHGAQLAYVPAIEEVPQALLEVRPTVMAAVPRFFEKLYGRVMEQVRGAPKARQKIFWWAVSVGRRKLKYDLNHQSAPTALALQHRLADKLVFRKLRERLGGRLKFVISGSAPLSPEIAEFFFACGLVILEGYGLTETSPVLAANVPDSVRIGTVGKPAPGVEIKIAEDGEILARGPNIMMGYYNLPEDTAAAMRDGWFHTGDIGHLDADGYLTITDRKKDLMKTSGGKFVAPQPIENKLKLNPYILNAVVLGDRRRFVSALIVPNLDKLAEHAQRQGIAFQQPAELTKNPQIVSFMEKQVQDWTPELAHFEQIKRVVLLDKDFSIAEGTMTPSMKVRRAMIVSEYAPLIEELYRE